MWDVIQNYCVLTGMEMYNLDETKFCHKQNFTDIVFQCVSCLMKDFSNGPHTTSWNNVMFKAEYEQESLFKKKKKKSQLQIREVDTVISWCVSLLIKGSYCWFPALSSLELPGRLILCIEYHCCKYEHGSAWNSVCVTFIWGIQCQMCLFCP